MKFISHVPDFVDGVEPLIIEGTFQEILNSAHVQDWKTGRHFTRFSISDAGSGTYHLMVELNGGKRWWVIGYLDEYTPELPWWKKPE